MKKSGTFASFFLFGLLAQAIFLLTYIVLVREPITWSNIFASIFAATSFVFLRLAMDWKTFDNETEDSLRRLTISDKPSDRFAFAVFAGSILVFFNQTLLVTHPYRVVFLAVLAVLLAHSFHELAREQYNEIRTYFELKNRKIFRLKKNISEVKQLWPKAI